MLTCNVSDYGRDYEASYFDPTFNTRNTLSWIGILLQASPSTSHGELNMCGNYCRLFC